VRPWEEPMDAEFRKLGKREGGEYAKS
jgi:hypothetical protein